MKKNLALIISVLLLSALSAPAATKISAVASPLRVTAGEEVKITVYCVDTSTNYLQKGILIKFTVAAGGGKVTPASGTSDESGMVKATLVTGPKSGTNAVKIESTGANTVYVSVNSEALPPTEFSAKIEPDKAYYNQTASLVVIVKNAKGELFKDAEVKVTPSGLVTANPATAKTDAQGTAKIAIKTGKQTGAARIEVAVAGLDVKTLDFEVLPPGAKNIETGASSLNIGTRNKTTLTAKIIDTSDQPMEKVPINFQIDSGDATLSANQAITDGKGTCSVELTAGNSAGVVVVKISSSDFKAVDMKINVSAVILPPAFLTAKANEASIFVGDETTVTATVEDKDRRLINGAAVKFERVTGGGTLLSPAGTTESGKASTIFTAGLAPGKTIIKVTCGTLPPAIVTINAETSVGQNADEKSGKAAKVFLIADNMSPALLTRPSVIALVTDANNIPVFGAEVKFSSESNSVPAETVKTNENGEAVVPVTYYGLGKIKISAESEGVGQLLYLNYKMPEWAYLFPSIVLFALVFLLYFLKAGSLRKKLLSSSSALNSDLLVRYRVNGLLTQKKNFAACFIDIDEFKNYNTAAGFVRGDKVIAELAAIVRKHVPAADIAAHLGGDDFVYICEPKRAKSIADKITAEFDSKLLTYYSEDDYKNGFITIRHTDGMLFNYPLMKLSIGIAEPEKAAAKTYNELFEFGGRLLKSAKAKKEGKVVDDFDDEAERGPKKVKVGWFTVGAFILFLSLPGFLNAEVDISKKMKLVALPESTGIGQSVLLKARLTDNRDRPISGAFLLFEDLNKGDAIGGFSRTGSRTDKDGNVEVLYTVGERIGKSMVKVSFKGDRAVSTVFVGVHVNYLRYVFMLIGLVFLGFTIMYTLRFIKLGPLFQGIDPEVGMRTRVSAENRIRVLFKANIKFQVLFIDYRNFTGFNREYSYADGQKAVKAMGDQLKSIIKEFAPRDGEAFSYGEDKFVVVTKKSGEEIGKNIIEEMEIHIPLICQDKNANYYLLHLTVALVEVDPAKVKSLGEIMQIAGQLVSDAKTKPGSALLKG